MAVPAVPIASSRLPIASADIKVAVGIVIAATAICTLVLVADQWWGVDHYQLVRDPNAIANNPNYFGLVSNLGIVMWIAGAVGALQAVAALRQTREKAFSGLLLAGGCFAAVMGLDDLLMLHESIAATGIPEILVLGPHAILLAATCYRAWLLQGRTPWLLLVACVAAFGCSMVVDVVPVEFAGQVFIEESFKLLGIMFLTAYLVITSQKALRSAPHDGFRQTSFEDR